MLLGENIAGYPRGGTGRDADVALCLCLVSGVDTGLMMQGTIPGWGWRHYKTLVMTFRLWVTALLNRSLLGMVAQATVSRASQSLLELTRAT